MTSSQRLTSCLLVAHLSAIFIAAVPPLDTYNSEMVARDPAEPITRGTARLDEAANDVVWLHRVVWGLTERLRQPAFAYVRVTGLFQMWNMFSNPLRRHQYARVGYRLRLANGTAATEYEQIFPAGPTGVVKSFSAYFDSFMDKAMSNAAETYRTRAARAEAEGRSIPTDEMIDGLRPYMRYFGRRRVLSGVPAGAQLTAVEFWWGTAPNPAPPLAGRARMDPNTTRQIHWQRWAVDDWQ